MSNTDNNILKSESFHGINDILSIISHIKEKNNIASSYLDNMIKDSDKLSSNEIILNPIEQDSSISSQISKIQELTLTIKEYLETENLHQFKYLEKNDLLHQINDVAKNLLVTNEKIKIFNTKFKDDIIRTKRIPLNDRDNSGQIKCIDELINHNLNTIESLIFTYDQLASIQSQILKSISNNKEKINLNYISRFKEDTSLLIKKYENELSSMFESFNNSLKDMKLDQEKALKSTALLNQNAESGITKLAQINKRIQEVELEVSQSINNEKEFIKSALESAKDDLDIDILLLIDEAKAKAKHIDTQAEDMKTSHKDFLKIVEKSAIYELTENYKNKADEEKKDYVTNRRWTVGAICLAILTTVIVIALPIWEHWSANPPVEANYFTVFARLSVSIMFFVLALYTSKQAAKHYECYQENHRTFLQLAALEPFISRMSDEEKLNIRKTLVPIYFNQNADGKFAAKSDEVDLPSNLHALVNRAFDVISEKKEQNNKSTPE